jgi:hypothetical protein
MKNMFLQDWYFPTKNTYRKCAFISPWSQKFSLAHGLCHSFEPLSGQNSNLTHVLKVTKSK